MNEKDKQLMHDVRTYGKLIERWDSYDFGLEQVDDTNSAFLWEYEENHKKYHVVIIMRRGEFVDYFMKEVL